MGNPELAKKIADAGGKMTPLALKTKLKDYFDKNIEAMTKFLAGNKEEAERLYLAVTTSISRNTGLLDCDPSSICLCMMTSAQLNLYPGVLEECAYVPYKGKAQFQPMYKGIIKLCTYAGMKKIAAVSVHENDTFDFQEGTDAYISHKRAFGKDRGPAIGYYAIAMNAFDEMQFVLMDKHEIEKIKGRSKSVQAGRSSPWDTDFDEMAKKTVVKRLCKMLTKSTRDIAQVERLQKAIEIDNEMERPDLAKQGPIVDLISSGTALPAPSESIEDAAPQEPELQEAFTAAIDPEKKSRYLSEDPNWSGKK